MTARKREEKLLDAPVAISALSGASIDALDLKTLEDMAAYIPGMTADNTINGTGRADRSYQEIIIRGATPASIAAQTTAIFVNGAPVVTGDIQGIEDLARVEVLKGPQAAYFGRSTFAGAVNFVTREPGNEFQGNASLLLGTRNTYDARVAIGGPIVQDVLMFRLAGRISSKDGSYDNPFYAGQTLGDQSTKSVALTVVAKPFENFTAKIYGAYWLDDDGPSATGLIRSNQSNCSFTVFGAVHPYYCGTVPALLPGLPSANVTITSAVNAYLNDTTALTHRLLAPADTLQDYGLERKAYHYSIALTYDVPSLGFSISSLTAANDDRWSALSAFSGVDARTTAGVSSGETYSDIPAMTQRKGSDFSQEIRLTSEQKRQFRWLVGASYLSMRNQIYVSTYLDFLRFLGANPNTETPFGPNTAKTYSAFFGLSYDLTDTLTLNAEGRYQSDTEEAYDSLDNSKRTFSQTYRYFLPRAIMQYRPTTDLMVYATFSRGANPGAAPVGLGGLTLARQAEAIAKGAANPINPEYLNNYELGIKGKLFNGRATFSADIYYGDWNNKIVQSTAILTAGPGFPNALSYFNNAGKVTLKGVEVEAQFLPFNHVLVNMSGAINDSRIDRFTCGQCVLLTGQDNEVGSQLPNSSKYSFAGGLQYSNALNIGPKSTWYARADFTYKSGLYESALNLAQTKPSTSLNLRVGAALGRFTIDVAANNVLNDRNYLGVLPQFNFGSSRETYAAYDSLVVGLPALRAVTVKLGTSF